MVMAQDFRTCVRDVVETVVPLTEEQRVRGDLAGYYDQVVEGYVKTRPVLSGGASEALRWAAMQPHDVLLRTMLDEIGTEEWRRAYMAHNKLVVDSVTGVSTVVSRIPNVTVAPFVQGDKAGAQEALKLAGGLRRNLGGEKKKKEEPRVRRYMLLQLLEDVDLQISLGLRPKFVELVCRQAAVDVGVACSLMQKALKDNQVDAVVQPGGYSKSLKHARASILQAQEGTRGTPVSLDIVVTGEKALCQGGRQVNGVFDWLVSGPLWRTHEVVAIARLASVKGSVVVNQLLEGAMLVCGIELIQQTVDGLPIGSVVACSGPLMAGCSGSDGNLLAQCVRDAATRVLPVVRGGCVIGNSVQMSSVSSLVNAHVFESDGGGSDSSGPLRLGTGASGVLASLVQSVGYDLWLTSHSELGAVHEPWLRRAAQVSEYGRLVYSGLKGVEFSELVKVLYAESGSLITSRVQQARGGMSGAAFVAERDGALLGVFHGYTYDKCVFSVLVGDVGLESDAEVVRQSVVATNSHSDELYESLRDRGLVGVVNVVAAVMEPVYAQTGAVVEQVANAVALSVGSVYTTVNPDVWSLQDASGKSYAFQVNGVDRYVAQDNAPVGVSVGLVRKPIVGEQVTVMGKDGDGPYFSQVLRVGRVERGGERFWLDGLPSGSFVFAGGVVLALADAAVLGQFVMKEGGAEMSRCVVVADPQGMGTETPSVVAVQTVFPMLHPAAWDVAALDGVVALDPVVLAQYTEIGRSSLKSALMLQLARQRDDARLTAVHSCVHDSVWLMGLAVEGGFVGVLNSAGVFSMQGISQGKVVEVFLSLLGLAAVNEVSENFQAFISTTGLVDRVTRGPTPNQLSAVASRDLSPVFTGVRPLSWSGHGMVERGV